jgi:hypothetical protein|tara:strand:+ start:33 stop:200 length:168 start_codon:yes stop_codon:yes gene_type:complete
MLQENPRAFLRLLVSLLPKRMVQKERFLNVDIKDLSLVKLLRLGDLSDKKLESMN